MISDIGPRRWRLGLFMGALTWGVAPGWYGSGLWPASVHAKKVQTPQKTSKLQARAGRPCHYPGSAVAAEISFASARARYVNGEPPPERRLNPHSCLTVHLSLRDAGPSLGLQSVGSSPWLPSLTRSATRGGKNLKFLPHPERFRRVWGRRCNRPLPAHRVLRRGRCPAPPWACRQSAGLSH